MTRIDFHTNIADKLAYACRLARKAYAARASLVLLAQDAAQAAALDEALWSVSPTDFLPHVMAGDALAAHTPILVTHLADSALDGLAQGAMLINLSSSTPAILDRFERMFEIISTDPEDAAAGRKRYAAYKQQAYPLTHHVANQL